MGKFNLDGSMIPRTVRRMFDQRCEERSEPHSTTAVLGWRDRDHVVRILNISGNGAMLAFHSVPNIGEVVRLKCLGSGDITAVVRWVRDGRIGINFLAPLE